MIKNYRVHGEYKTTSSMKASGRTVRSMATAARPGSLERYSRASSPGGSSAATVGSSTKAAPAMSGSGRTRCATGMGSIPK